MTLNGFATTFLIINILASFLLPRKWALLPVLVGACYMARGQGIEIFGFSFTVLRLLLAVGFARAIFLGEIQSYKICSMDKLMIGFSACILFSCIFHKDIASALVFRSGLVYDSCGVYFLTRIFLQSLPDIVAFCRITAILLLPISLLMLNEHNTGINIFSVFGGIAEQPSIREGRIRAQGPFAHAILAGTVGGVCLPLMIAIWQRHRISAIVGVFACLTMVFACASSGPIMSAMAGIGALCLWRYRSRMKIIRWLSAFAYIGLDFYMKDPAYYILARIDLAGGSTGWHRAYLIDMAFKHIDEWWLGGTDYTRHWMPTGVSWSEDHADITNHYLRFGTIGGLPLMMLLIGIFVRGFSYVGQTLMRLTESSSEFCFLVWALGASLFAHAATCTSVSYFDQSSIFLYLILSAIASAWSATMTNSIKYDEHSGGSVKLDREVCFLSEALPGSHHAA
jgi:hypothetical protein